jgi:hypothetical protein
MLESSSIWDFFREIPAILRRPVYLGHWSTPAGKRERLRKRTIARQQKSGRTGAVRTSERMLEGVVSAGRIKEYAIEGVEFTLAEDAWVIGTFVVGCTARVRIPPSFGDGDVEVTTVTVLQGPRI